MPKYTADPENVTAEGPDVSMVVTGDTSTSAATTTKELSKKELGRMKSKQAVLAAKTQKQQRPEASEGGADDDSDIEKPMTKRARSVADSGHSEGKEEIENVDMTSEG